MTHDVRTGDTWRSEKGGRLVTVVPRSDYYVWHNRPDTDPLHAHEVFYRGVTRAVMTALADNFVRGRTLIERGGIRVGDVRAMGKASTTKVLVLREDIAVCDDPDGIRTYPAAEVAALRLLARDGKAATP